MTLDQCAAGHGGVSILRFVDADDEDPNRPKCVMKEYDETEAHVYKVLAENRDALQPFAPQFYGEVEPEDIPEDLEEGSRYMKLSNLLRNFGTSPHVMDCKMGIRSFIEEESRVKKLRKDLYLRMLELDVNAPTEEENSQQGCTKFRWMTFNDSITTTAKLGARIDGISNSQGNLPQQDLKLLQTVSDMSKCIVDHFFSGHNSADASTAAESVLSRLRAIQEAFLTSAFASRHSFVGTSLLFIVEQGGPSAAVYMIDFAKTLPLPEGVAIDHRSPWVPGNYEDGLLTGLENLIVCWEEVTRRFSETISVSI
jgi:1D-myo-inositol-triphosphate 3-kinase